MKVCEIHARGSVNSAEDKTLTNSHFTCRGVHENRTEVTLIITAYPEVYTVCGQLLTPQTLQTCISVCTPSSVTLISLDSAQRMKQRGD